MPGCKYLEKCPFFNSDRHGFGDFNELLRKKYCHGNSSECARYAISEQLGAQMVPADMLPSQHESAHRLVMAHARNNREPIAVPGGVDPGVRSQLPKTDTRVIRAAVVRT